MGRDGERWMEGRRRKEDSYQNRTGIASAQQQCFSRLPRHQEMSRTLAGVVQIQVAHTTCDLSNSGSQGTKVAKFVTHFGLHRAFQASLGYVASRCFKKQKQQKKKA